MRFIGPIGVLVLVACDAQTVDDIVDTAGELTDEEMATQIWSDIEGYQSWSQYDPWIGVQPSSSPHGPYVQIWLDGTAVAALGGTIPNGGVLAKESYDTATGEPKGYTLMVKIDGYAPEAGDWFWASWDGDGVLKEAGAISSCVGCHEDGDDYVMIIDVFPAGSDTGR